MTLREARLTDTHAPTGAAHDAASHAGAKVLRDTYRLLSFTLVFSGAMAFASWSLGLPAPGLLLTLAGYFGLLFLTARLRNSIWGLPAVFALTGFMGYTLGTLLTVYLSLDNGAALVGSAATTAGLAFLGLSALARSGVLPNFGRFGTFLTVGIITAFGLGIAAFAFELPGLAVAVSGLFVLLMCGLIVFETQNILNGGETNYIMATVTLYVAIYNLFTSLLHIFGVVGEDG